MIMNLINVLNSCYYSVQMWHIEHMKVSTTEKKFQPVEPYIVPKKILHLLNPPVHP